MLNAFKEIKVAKEVIQDVGPYLGTSDSVEAARAVEKPKPEDLRSELLNQEELSPNNPESISTADPKPGPFPAFTDPGQKLWTHCRPYLGP
jgi:hypothetical protein